MERNPRGQNLGNGAVAGALVSGTAALVVAAMATMQGEGVTASVALLAAAVAFAGVANVVFRH
jgi:hypothetical protein